MSASAASPADEPVDVRRCFAKVLKRHANGLVLFEFSIAWRDLTVELVLPEAAFDEFCARNAVSLVD